MSKALPILFFILSTIFSSYAQGSSTPEKRDTFTVFALYMLDSTEQNETGRFTAVYVNGKPSYFIRQSDKLVFQPSKILLHRRIH